MGLSGDHGYEGAKCVCSPPPLRLRGPRSGARWPAACSACSPPTTRPSATTTRPASSGGERPSFDHIPNGVPGIETRLPLLFDGIARGKLTLHQFVALTSYRPARLYGLYPRKGTIAVGADADIVLWDPARKVRIANAELHHAVDYTPYEGIEVTGWPVHCFSRGDAGGGRYLEPLASGRFGGGGAGDGLRVRCLVRAVSVCGATACFGSRDLVLVMWVWAVLVCEATACFDSCGEPTHFLSPK